MLSVKPRQPWARGVAVREPGPDHCVQDEEQLAHGRDECHLPGLAPPAQTGVEVTDDRVVTDGDHNGHVEGSYARSPSARRWPRPGPRSWHRCSTATRAGRRRTACPQLTRLDSQHNCRQACQEGWPRWRSNCHRHSALPSRSEVGWLSGSPMTVTCPAQPDADRHAVGEARARHGEYRLSVARPATTCQPRPASTDRQTAGIRVSEQLRFKAVGALFPSGYNQADTSLQDRHRDPVLGICGSPAEDRSRLSFQFD